MSGFVHQIVSGLAMGFIYASLALALVMIFKSTNHINFAQGEMAMFSTYVAWFLVQSGLPYWGAFALTLVGSFMIGFATERLIMRRFDRAPVFAIVIVFIGLLLLFNSLAGWLYGYEMRAFQSPFPSRWGSPVASSHEIGVAGVTLLVFLAVFLFFRFTSLGLAMRAASQNPISSRLVGINVGVALATGWGLAAMIGSLAGIMAAPIVYLDPNMMSGIMIYAFAAALLGGINSPAGAVPGGLLIGVLENLMGSYVVGTELKFVVALFFIVMVLLVKPSGLFGSSIQTRV
jgi:branched-chain amino acid transport system permease protein